MDSKREAYSAGMKKEKEIKPKWYAVYTGPRFEKQVLKSLLDHGIESDRQTEDYVFMKGI